MTITHRNHGGSTQGRSKQPRTLTMLGMAFITALLGASTQNLFASETQMAASASYAIMPEQPAEKATFQQQKAVLDRVRNFPTSAPQHAIERYYPNAEQWNTYYDKANCESCQGNAQAHLVGINFPINSVNTFTGFNGLAASSQTQIVSGGVFQKLPDGTSIYRKRIEAPEARGIRLHFTGFDLHGDAKMYIYSDAEEIYGPYTGRGIFGNGDFWSNTVSADHCNIIVQFPANTNVADIRGTKFDIESLGYIVKTLAPGGAGLSDGTPEMLSCIRDATCYSATSFSEIAATRGAAGQMSFASGGNIYVCSGGLINTSPSTFIPYFLTANHCISSSAEASSLEVTWNFSTSICNVGFNDWLPTTGYAKSLGATIVSTGEVTDYTLLRLSQNPPGGSFFLGWTSDLINAGTTLYRIAHPQAAPQAFSIQSAVVPSVSCPTLPTTNFLYSSNSLGGTDGGSSGSPVVNASGQIVGQLYGRCGMRNCNTCSADCNVVDGRFSVTYSHISRFLNIVAGSCEANGDLLSTTDLTGAWQKIKWNSKKGKLNGKFMVSGSADRSQVISISYYVSADQEFDSSDELLGTGIGKHGKKGYSVKVKTLSSNAGGNYILAVIDEGNEIPEYDKCNNVSAIQVISKR